MPTTTKARKPQTRTAKLMKLGRIVVLALTTDKDTTFYKLETLLAAAGRGFRLVKAERGGRPGEEYDVQLDGPRSSCECKGFLRWNHCKHVEALATLAAAGRLAAASVPKDPEPADPCCGRCGHPASYHDGACCPC